MKRTIFFTSLIALLAACGGGASNKPASDSAATTTAASKPAEADMSGNPDYQKGLALVANSDCFTCHKIDEKLTGPAYQEVANKYANAGDTVVPYLAHRIINGGSGVWGEAAMTPHADLSEADAEAMAKYVLLLKK